MTRKTPDLAIVDLGYGNIGSIAIAFRRFGVEPRVTADPAALAAASHVVLPGVGAAGFAMRRVHELDLAEPLRRLTNPVLGICLGMQLLFDRSQEDNGVDCLRLIPGAVEKLDPAPDLPVPHMGWSRLSVRDEAVGLADGDYVYFAHSFACPDGPATLASADYGRAVPAVVRHANFLGAQFHPERSGPAGARFLEAFLSQ
ncbi:MAG TPA: imidazole glycerol phosphate synthase subunit HisH [Sphingomonadaceae bacterium]|nr:imidazole glycerol phosphate synthase subunit HisH [Sphingomonadaceae bacterium]